MALDRVQKPLRLTRDAARRVEEAAKSAGKYEQRFMEDAVMRATKEEEDRRASAREARRQRDDGGARRTEEPVGLGLNLRPRHAPEPAPVPAAPQGVVVNVGAAATAGPGLVAGLAAWIVDGPEYDRRSRTVQAVDILKAQPGADAEALAGQLDAAVAAVRPRERAGGLSNLLRGSGLGGLKEYLKL